MKLIECYIENFGKLSSFRHSFDERINCFCEENSWGKTTLAAFIKAMFYGLPVTRTGDLLKNERKKYYPWNNGTFGGSLSFEYDEKKYRIERIFSKNGKDDFFKLTDLDTGKECDDFGENIGYAVFGINSAAYTKSSFVTKDIPEDSKDEGLKSITAKLNGIIDSTDIENYNNAVKALDEKRKYYSVSKGGGVISESQKRLTELSLALHQRREREKELSVAQSELSEIETLLYEKDKIYTNLTDLFKKQTKYSEMSSKHREYKTRENTLQSLQNEHKELSLFFANGVPDKKELLDCEKAIASFESLKKDIALSEDPFCVRAAQEEEFFSAYMPDSSELTKLYKDHSDALNECENVSEFSESDLSELKALEKMSFPSDDELDSHSADLSRIAVLKSSTDFLEESIQKVSVPEKSAHGRTKLVITLALSFAVMVIGMLISLANTLAGITVGAAGFVLVLISAFLYIKNYINDRLDGASAHSDTFVKRLELERAELSSLMRKCDNFNTQYAIDPQKGDALQTIRERIRRFGALSERYEEHKKNRELACLHLETAEKAILAMYSKIGHTELAVSDISQLVSRHSIYLQIKERADLLRKSAKQASVLLGDAQKSTEAFFSRFPSSLSEPGEKLYEIRTKAERFGTLSKSLLSAKAAFISFVSENPGCETAPEMPQAFANPDRDIEKELDAARLEVQQLEKRKTALSLSIAKLCEIVENASDLEEQIESETLLLEHRKHRLAVIEKTKELLAKAKDDLSGRYLGRMKEKFSHYLSMLAENDLLDGELDSDLEITLPGGGIMRESDYFSTGLRDLVYLALRLALSDALFEKEKSFIILDDPFANLDNDKLSRAVTMLYELSKETQIIYFTCHTSRAL